jgi:hypothetical protein
MAPILIEESKAGIGVADGFAKQKVLKGILKGKLFQEFSLKPSKAVGFSVKKGASRPPRYSVS